MLVWRLELEEVQSNDGTHGPMSSSRCGDLGFCILLHRGDVLNYRVVVPQG